MGSGEGENMEYRTKNIEGMMGRRNNRGRGSLWGAGEDSKDSPPSFAVPTWLLARSPVEESPFGGGGCTMSVIIQ